MLDLSQFRFFGKRGTCVCSGRIKTDRRTEWDGWKRHLSQPGSRWPEPITGLFGMALRYRGRVLYLQNTYMHCPSRITRSRWGDFRELLTVVFFKINGPRKSMDVNDGHVNANWRVHRSNGTDGSNELNIIIKDQQYILWTKRRGVGAAGKGSNAAINMDAVCRVTMHALFICWYFSNDTDTFRMELINLETVKIAWLVECLMMLWANSVHCFVEWPRSHIW